MSIRTVFVEQFEKTRLIYAQKMKQKHNVYRRWQLESKVKIKLYKRKKSPDILHDSFQYKLERILLSIKIIISASINNKL